jgi:hypothetical protein
MADERLRELEREAEQDPAARPAFVRELARTRDPRVLEIEALVGELEQRLAAIQADVDGQLDPQARRCPPLRVELAQAAVRAALAKRDGFAGVGYGYKTLARVWPSTWDPSAELGELSDPLVPMAFAARLDDEVTLGVEVSSSRKATPGTTWPELAPWSESRFRPETVESKLRLWTTEAPELWRMPLARAQLWVELSDQDQAAVPAEPRRVVDLDRPSDKQLGLIESLVQRKGVAADDLGPFLRAHANVKQVELLDRPGASAVIEALLELPNKKRTTPKPGGPAKAASKRTAAKVGWQGILTAVRPRITMTLVMGQEQHGYQGYTLCLTGTVDGESRAFRIGIGKAAQAKHAFQAGDEVSGAAVPVAPGARVAADYYKASKLELLDRQPPTAGEPPWLGAPPELSEYRARGHRDLDADVLSGESPCATCLWACEMPVEGGKDDQPHKVVCYGPADCSAYCPF